MRCSLLNGRDDEIPREVLPEVDARHKANL